MQEKGCFVRKIEFRDDEGTSSFVDVDIPFNDIHRLHASLERIGYERRCAYGTIIVAYDLRGNIISALAFDENSTGVQPAISPSVATHSKIWEKSLDEINETFDSGKFPSFNDSLAKKLKESSLISYKNGSQLLADAELLFDNGRLARSGSLSILAFEEFSKSFILQICLRQKRWDRSIYLGLRDHSKKHAILYGALAISPTLARYNSFLFGGGQIIPTSQIEKIVKNFANKKYLDKLKQALQFSDVKKDGSCQNVSTVRQDTCVGIYLAKLAWYYLSYLHEGINRDNVIRIEKGITIQYPCCGQNLRREQFIHVTHTIYFGDSTICTVNSAYENGSDSIYDPTNNVLDTTLRPIISRAQDIQEGRRSEKFSDVVHFFWIRNQEILDVCGQLQCEIERLGYRYSPYLAAIKEALS